MDYMKTVLLYYLCILLLQAPWVMLFVGAVRRVRQHTTRLRRFQFEGMFLVVAGWQILVITRFVGILTETQSGILTMTTL